MSEEDKPFVPRTALDIQKMKLEKLMQNPDKPVIIPEGPREKKGHIVPEFVRNVMGSSAGAGSGEFHVYRHLRRKEYARQKIIDEMAQKEALDKAFINKMEENKRILEERTAKKRAKRLKKKQKRKILKVQDKVQKEENSENDSDESASSHEDIHSKSGEEENKQGNISDENENSISSKKDSESAQEKFYRSKPEDSESSSDDES